MTRHLGDYLSKVDPMSKSYLNFSGTIGLLDTNLNGLDLSHKLKSGHTDLVRAVYWNTERNYAISASEDGSISFWS